MLIELFGCGYSQMFEIFKNCISFLSSVQNSERGKKIGNVMVTTSRNVVQTGKAVGKAHPQQELFVMYPFSVFSEQFITIKL